MVKWDPHFAPSFTPLEMLELGVFEGKYINGIPGVPKEYYTCPKVLGPKDSPDPSINYYGVKSRQPLSEWQANGWIDKEDPYGWFEWYIKYFLGRRLPVIDSKQIGRWASFVARHQAQVNMGCKLTDRQCRPRQRQGLLQWAWDSTTLFTPAQREQNLTRIMSLAYPIQPAHKFRRG